MKKLSDLIKEISDQEYKEMLDFIESNRKVNEEPYVGLFWYNKTNNELFGVIKHPISFYKTSNCGGGKISCSELYEDIWKKEYYKQKYKNNSQGNFIGQYQDKPRGRIFYNIKEDTYEICVGEWIKDYEKAIDLIVDEFQLNRVDYKFLIKEHWNIGQTWM